MYSMNISIDKLKELVNQIFLKVGCPTEVAKACTHSLILAEVCGVKTHGLNMVSKHVQKILNGEYNLAPTLIKNLSTTTFARFDANNTIGMYSATKCMDYAIQQAKESGIYSVFAHHCNTLSAAFVYALQAIQEEMIGIVMSNAPAQMPPIGGRSKLLGTNPIAFAIPAKKKHPIIVDMATSTVAKSKIIEARDKGLEIPLNWALDSDGNPTNNAQKALEGLVLPMAGAKGYSLAIIIDILTGVLSGANYLNNVNRFYNPSTPCMNVGHTFIAINPKLIIGEEFYTKIDNYINIIHSSDSINNQTRVKLPGERKLEKKLIAEKNGYEINEELYNELMHFLRYE